MDRPRRRLGCWIACVVLLLGGLALWLLLPRLLCMVANASLPRELAPQATLLAVHPAVGRMPAAPIVLQVDPALMRRIAADASGRWIPPGVVRHGLGAIGTVRGEGNVAIGWQAWAADAVIPPRLSVTLTPQQADALLASVPGGNLAGMAVQAQLAALELAALPDDGENRRFRVEAAGALRLSSGTLAFSVPVRRLVAQVTVVFTPSAAGWEPAVRLHIDALDAPLPTLPGVEPAMWSRLLERWIEERIADKLAGRTVPAWFPTDIRIAAVVR